MSGQPTWRECAAALADFLANGRATDARFTEDERIAYALIGANLIRREEVEKRCSCCGKPKLDYSYWKVTAAGRMLVDAYREQVSA